MPRVPTRVVKDRSRRLTRLFEGFRPYEGMAGEEVDVSALSGFWGMGVVPPVRCFFWGGVHPHPPLSPPPTTPQVWINAEVSQDGRHTVGHTKSYIKVLVPRDPALVGTQARVRVRVRVRSATNITHTHMYTYTKSHLLLTPPKNK